MEYLLWIFGYALVVIVGWLLKKSIEKSIDSSIEAVFAKNIAKYQDSLTRASTARQFIFNHEMAFFESADEQVSELIPIIQDMRDSVDNCTFSEYDKKCYLKFFESIFALKKLALKYETYIPEEIYVSYQNLVVEMQTESEMWHDFAAMLSSGEQPSTEDRENAQQSCDGILRSIALVRLNQIKYIKGISNSES